MVIIIVYIAVVVYIVVVYYYSCNRNNNSGIIIIMHNYIFSSLHQIMGEVAIAMVNIMYKLRYLSII